MPDGVFIIMFACCTLLLILFGLRYFNTHESDKETLGILIVFTLMVNWGWYSYSFPLVISNVSTTKVQSINQANGIYIQGFCDQVNENKFVNLNDYFHGTLDDGSCIKIIRYKKWYGGIYYLDSCHPKYEIVPCP